MSPAVFVLPEQYGLVVLSACGSIALTTTLAIASSALRKPAKCPAPAVYSTETTPAAIALNKGMRAYYNTLENLPLMLVGLGFAGLRWPVVASSLGAVWSASRVWYYVGYTGSFGVTKRSGGFMGSFLAQLVLLGMAATTGWGML